jgi:hypothetical protein
MMQTKIRTGKRNIKNDSNLQQITCSFYQRFTYQNSIIHKIEIYFYPPKIILNYALFKL